MILVSFFLINTVSDFEIIHKRCIIFAFIVRIVSYDLLHFALHLFFSLWEYLVWLLWQFFIKL